MSNRSLTTARNQAVELIRTVDAAFVATHVRPDGDALGCLLALALALESRGCRVARLCADAVSPNYQFLPGADRVTSAPPEWRPQVGFVVDCDGLARAGSLEGVFAPLPQLVDIDHHATDQAFGDIQVVDPTSAATGEIVFDLLRRAGVRVDAGIATCLYAAILTDTGRFGYTNTTARSLTIGSRLVRAGADPHHITRRIYEERSIAATHLLGVALSRLSADCGDEVVSSALTLSDFAEAGAVAADTEGIIDHLRAIGGTRVALLFVEMEDGQVRVSLRSDGTLDVGRIALSLGGGGHVAAAGCTIMGTAASAREEVLSAVRRSLPRVGLDEGH